MSKFKGFSPKGLDSGVIKLFPMSIRLSPQLVIRIIWPTLESTSAIVIFSVRFAIRFEIGDTWNFPKARLHRFNKIDFCSKSWVTQFFGLKIFDFPKILSKFMMIHIWWLMKIYVISLCFTSCASNEKSVMQGVGCFWQKNLILGSLKIIYSRNRTTTGKETAG